MGAGSFVSPAGSRRVGLGHSFRRRVRLHAASLAAVPRVSCYAQCSSSRSAQALAIFRGPDWLGMRSGYAPRVLSWVGTWSGPRFPVSGAALAHEAALTGCVWEGVRGLEPAHSA